MNEEKNTGKPDEAELLRLSEDGRFFKAVANYLANVLGIDRNRIDRMLAEKVESRNVDQLVSEAVCRYFGFGPDAAGGIEYAVSKRLDKTVDQYVRETMDKTCRGWIDRQVQIKVQEIAGLDAGTPAPKDAIVTETRPGLWRYPEGAYLELPLLQKIAGDWIRNNMPVPARVNFTVKLNPSADDAVCLDIYNLIGDEADLFNTLKETPVHSRTPLTSTRVKQYGVAKLAAEFLGWDKIGRMVADTGGVAVFPPEI